MLTVNCSLFPDVLLFSTSLREKRPFSEFFWSVFSHIWTKYGEILRVFPYSVRMQENTKNSEYGHFSGNAWFVKK